MAWIAYFYLLRPSEHCKAPENSLLILADVTLLISSTRLALLTATPADLNRATHSSLTFDTQKNRERGEVIAHSRSRHTMACPTKSLIRRVRYLRSMGLPLATPFADRIPSTTPGAEPPRDARDSGSARSHSTHLETSSPDRPNMVTYMESKTVSSYMSVKCTRRTLLMPNFTRATHAQPSLSNIPWRDSDFGEWTHSRGTTQLE